MTEEPTSLVDLKEARRRLASSLEVMRVGGRLYQETKTAISDLDQRIAELMPSPAKQTVTDTRMGYAYYIVGSKSSVPIIDETAACRIAENHDADEIIVFAATFHELKEHDVI